MNRLPPGETNANIEPDVTATAVTATEGRLIDGRRATFNNYNVHLYTAVFIPRNHTRVALIKVRAPTTEPEMPAAAAAAAAGGLRGNQRDYPFRRRNCYGTTTAPHRSDGNDDNHSVPRLFRLLFARRKLLRTKGSQRPFLIVGGTRIPGATRPSRVTSARRLPRDKSSADPVPSGR